MNTTEKRMKSLHDAFLLLEFGQKALMEAFLECKREASQSYFMAVNMMFMAVLSSIYAESQKVLDSIRLEYAQLYDVCPNRTAWPMRLGEDTRTHHVPEEIALEFPKTESLENEGMSSHGSSKTLETPTTCENTTAENKSASIETKRETYHASLLMQQKHDLSESIFNAKSEPESPQSLNSKKKKKPKKKKQDFDEIDDLFSQFV
jgi:hypothetical protein